MDPDRRHEQQRRPVVDLAYQQAATHIEADVQCGLVRLTHPDAVQLEVAAVVDDLGHAGLEEQGQEGAGQHQDDERVQCDLAEQERPVIWEGLPQHAAGELRRPETVVDVASQRPRMRPVWVRAPDSSPFPRPGEPSAPGRGAGAPSIPDLHRRYSKPAAGMRRAPDNSCHDLIPRVTADNGGRRFGGKE